MPRRFAGVVLLLFALAPASTLAQPEPGTIGIYADPAGTIDRFTPPPFVPVQMYVVAHDPPGGIDAYQFVVRGILELGGVILANGVPGINLEYLEPNEFSVTTDECLTGDTVVLATLNVIFFTAVPSDAAICLVGFGDAVYPRYLDCDGTERDFRPTSGQGMYPDGCAILNPTQDDICCPSYERELDMPEVLAQVGETKRLPLRVDEFTDSPCGIQRTTCLPFEIHGFRGTLDFDPSLVDLVDVTIGGQIDGWNIVTEQLEPGRVVVEAVDSAVTIADLQHPLPLLDNDALLTLEFEVLAPGTAFITFEQAGLCGWSASAPIVPCPYPTDLTIVGAITQDPVRNDASSFGALKARFEN